MTPASQIITSQHNKFKSRVFSVILLRIYNYVHCNMCYDFIVSALIIRHGKLHLNLKFPSVNL
jgi:hypothetical protein